MRAIDDTAINEPKTTQVVASRRAASARVRARGAATITPG
jgi:hypothetical protein